MHYIIFLSVCQAFCVNLRKLARNVGFGLDSFSDHRGTFCFLIVLILSFRASQDPFTKVSLVHATQLELADSTTPIEKTPSWNAFLSRCSFCFAKCDFEHANIILLLNQTNGVIVSAVLICFCETSILFKKIMLIRRL